MCWGEGAERERGVITEKQFYFLSLLFANSTTHCIRQLFISFWKSSQSVIHRLAAQHSKPKPFGREMVSVVLWAEYSSKSGNIIPTCDRL